VGFDGDAVMTAPQSLQGSSCTFALTLGKVDACRANQPHTAQPLWRGVSGRAFSNGAHTRPSLRVDVLAELVVGLSLVNGSDARWLNARLVGAIA